MGYVPDGTPMVQRIVAESCVGAIIDVQDFFLAQLGGRAERERVIRNILHFARLLGYFRVPIVATLERPVHRKGSLPDRLRAQLREARLFEKDFFDLTREKDISDYLAQLNKEQIVIAGCETDLCVLQSCLGFLDLGYRVFVVEDLIFSSARDVTAAVARMRTEGAVFLTYKTLYYEMIPAVNGGHHADAMVATYGRFPDDLPDEAES
jgi:isochorismate hydrolase